MRGVLATRSPLAYRPPAAGQPSLLQRAGGPAAIAYIGSLALVAFVYSSPIMLVAVGAAVAIAARASAAGPALALAARFALPLALVMVLVNVLVSERGETVLIRGFELPVLGSIDVTLESIAAGGTIALRVVVVIAAFAVMSRCVDPDAILRLVRPFARRSALTATLVGRLVPLAASDHARLREAAALRGPGAAPVGRAVLARRLVAGALDRSLDAAATLELRGYALAAPRAAPIRRRASGARAMTASAIAIALTGIAGRLAGLDGFSSYPRIEIDAGAADLALAAAVPLLAALPWLAASWRAAGARRAALGLRSQEALGG